MVLPRCDIALSGILVVFAFLLLPWGAIFFHRGIPFEKGFVVHEEAGITTRPVTGTGKVT